MFCLYLACLVYILFCFCFNLFLLYVYNYQRWFQWYHGSDGIRWQMAIPCYFDTYHDTEMITLFIFIHYNIYSTSKNTRVKWYHDSTCPEIFGITMLPCLEMKLNEMKWNNACNAKCMRSIPMEIKNWLNVYLECYDKSICQIH